MNDLVETKQTEERVILVAVRQSDDDNTDRSLDELEELASTAGAVTVTRIIQNREAIHPGTYVGKGKIERSVMPYICMMQQVLYVMMS